MLSQVSETPGLKLTDEGEIQWAAGLYEGEGWLSQQKSGQWQLGVEMTDLDVLQHFAKIFDLRVSEKPDANNAPSTIRRKEANVYKTETILKTKYMTRACARKKIFAIICDIYPYLGARRREKCDEFLQWYAEKEGMKYD